MIETKEIPVSLGDHEIKLGAGLGLPGVAAGMRGAEVLQTDYMPQALDIAAENARLNKVNSLRTALADWRNFNITEKIIMVLHREQPRLYRNSSNH